MIHPTSFGRQDVLEKSIVVLPFVNISNDPDQEYFSDGLTEEIIADLSKIHDLLVISRSSSMTFKGTSKKIKEIAQDVNVKYVLEGSVRKAGNQIRVTAQLINATADTHLWSDKYTGVLDDVFDIQEKVSKAIVNELKIKLTEKESREISVHPIDNAVSYDFYLKARTYFLQWTKESTDQALALLQNAEELIGPNPTLYAGKAYAHWSYANLGIEPKANTQLSEQYVDKVFQLEPENPDGHLILGLLYQAFRGNPKLANHHFNRVLASRPHDYDALLWKYANYFTLGKMDAATKTLSKLTRLDPLSTISTCAEGWILMYEGKYSQSLPILKAAMEKEPSGIYKIFYGVALGCSGDFTALIDFLNRMPKLEEGHFGTIFTVFKELMQGDIDAARRDLNEDAWEWLKRDFQFSHLMAEIYCMAKQKEDTYKFLENAMSKGFCNYPLLSGPSPIYSLLHDEVRFQNLLVTMKQLWDEFETD